MDSYTQQGLMEKYRILIVDDHAVVREGIKMLLNAQPDMDVVGEAGNGQEAYQQTRDLMPDVVLMDVSMPIVNGAQATERIKSMHPEVQVLALSAFQDEAHIRQLLSSGAAGYVLKSTIAEDLTTAIRTVARGGVHLDPSVAGKVVGGYVNPASVEKGEASLTSREQEVLVHIALGYTNKEIAEKLHMSVKSVENQKARIMEKLDLTSRTDIVRFVLRKGWLQQEGGEA